MAGMMRLPNGNYVDPTKVVSVYTDLNESLVVVLLDIGENGVQVVAFDWRYMPAEHAPDSQAGVDEINAEMVEKIVRDLADLRGWVQK